MKTTVNLTPENVATLATYGQILGCTRTEFLNRFLALFLPAEFYDPETIMTDCLSKFEFKTREEAQRVFDWYVDEATPQNEKLGLKAFIKSEIMPMESLVGQDRVFKVWVTTSYPDGYNEGKSSDHRTNKSGPADSRTLETVHRPKIAPGLGWPN